MYITTGKAKKNALKLIKTYS